MFNEVTVHAVLLLLLPFITLFIVAMSRRRTPTRHDLIRSIVIAFGVAAIAVVFNHHMCMEGEPRGQWLILAPCVAVVMAFIAAKRLRVWLAAVLSCFALGLSYHYTELVHTRGWTGNPTSRNGDVMLGETISRDFASNAEASEYASRTFSAGWLRELPPWKEVSEYISKRQLYRRSVGRAWHSAFTGLYPYSSVPIDWWYPGGKWALRARAIELRDSVADR